jgi:hypothetical protein
VATVWRVLRAQFATSDANEIVVSVSHSSESQRAADDEEDSPRKPAAPVHARIFGGARMPVFIPTG